MKKKIAILGSTGSIGKSTLDVIKKDIKCSPCFERTCRFNHYECLTQITPELVFRTIQKLFSK